jgi:hypothetical protein
MPVTGYRPAVGETVFVSLSGNMPLLITVTGYRHHTHLKEDVMEFDRMDGSSNWSSFANQRFFTEIPVDTPYLYLLVDQYDDGYDRMQTTEIDFFFSPHDAFARMAALEQRDVSAGYTSDHDDYHYVVEVQKVV